MDASTSVADRITGQQLREAREGLTRLLHKKRFPREWIEREAPDAMAEAEKDLAARLAAGKGWGKSSADRHHRAALEKLKALFDPSM